MITASSGCIEEPNADGVPEVRQTTLYDGIGRKIAFREPVARAVSLAPDLTETIFAIGAGDRLVGVTTYCNYPEAAKSIEKVGDTQTPGIERIMALQPDLVFVSTASQLEAFLRILEDRQISVYVANSKNLEDIARNMQTFGSIFGVQAQGDKAAEELFFRSQAVDEVRRISVGESARPWPKVFVQISKEPLFTIGKDSFLTEIIGRAGGVSVTKDVATAYPKLSKETALAMNPDVIILSDSEDNREPNDVLKNSPAVRDGRVYRIDADIISRPGPRLVDALEKIATLLHQ